MQAMGHGFDAEYQPDPARATLYAKRYALYKKLGVFIEDQTMSTESAESRLAMQSNEMLATA
jgi:L-ribulokinase